VSDYRVPAVVSAIRVLGHLDARGDSGATQSELVEALGVSKSTMHNLVSTLEAEGFLRRDLNTRRYCLGPALIPLGAAALRQTKLIRIASDAVAPLAAHYDLSFAVVQRTADDFAQVVERFYPPQDVHVGVSLGSRFGISEGALGKLLLAAMEPEEAERLLLGRELPAYTDLTITDPTALLREVSTARERGWAVSVQELNENNAVAASVWGLTGEVELFLLGLGFPTQLEKRRLAEMGEMLRGVADSVMEAAGGTRPEPARR
jgi:DNA-binding IclR family transcriptional regulator